jgi:hypothetical protein
MGTCAGTDLKFASCNLMASVLLRSAKGFFDYQQTLTFLLENKAE